MSVILQNAKTTFCRPLRLLTSDRISGNLLNPTFLRIHCASNVWIFPLTCCFFSLYTLRFVAMKKYLFIYNLGCYWLHVESSCVMTFSLYCQKYCDFSGSQACFIRSLSSSSQHDLLIVCTLSGTIA